MAWSGEQSLGATKGRRGPIALNDSHGLREQEFRVLDSMPNDVLRQLSVEESPRGREPASPAVIDAFDAQIGSKPIAVGPVAYVLIEFVTGAVQSVMMDQSWHWGDLATSPSSGPLLHLEASRPRRKNRRYLSAAGDKNEVQNKLHEVCC